MPKPRIPKRAIEQLNNLSQRLEYWQNKWRGQIDYDVSELNYAKTGIIGCVSKLEQLKEQK